MSHEHRHSPSSYNRRIKIAWVVFAAIAVFFLWTEHQAHLLGALPFLLLLACPLMHLFMHHGHGKTTGETGEKPPEESK